MINNCAFISYILRNCTLFAIILQLANLTEVMRAKHLEKDKLLSLCFWWYLLLRCSRQTRQAYHWVDCQLGNFSPFIVHSGERRGVHCWSRAWTIVETKQRSASEISSKFFSHLSVLGPRLFFLLFFIFLLSFILVLSSY